MIVMSFVDENNWMIIRVTDLDLKDVLIKRAAELGLTISNDNETDTGIEHIRIGNAISVGTSEKFSVNWARDIDYYAKRGIVPVYDIQLDWYKITQRLVAYSMALKERKTKEEEDRFTIEIDSNDKVKVEDSDTITFNNDLTIDKETFDCLNKLAASGYDVKINQETSSITIENEDYTFTMSFDDADDIENAINERIEQGN